jgi:hypothetical protein
MNNILFGNTQITGNLIVTGSDTILKDNILGLSSPQTTPGWDSGILAEKNYSDYGAPTFTGLITVATETTVTISQTITEGWAIFIGAQKRKVISVAALVITVDSPLSPVPSPGAAYSLYKETNTGLIYKTSEDKFYLCATPQDSLKKIITDIVPKTLVVNNIQQANPEQIIYVGKHGNNAWSGRTISEAKLTFGAAVAANIVCLDSGIYNENITINFNLHAPQAQITSIVAATAAIAINIATITTITANQSCKIQAVFATNVNINADSQINIQYCGTLTVRNSIVSGYADIINFIDCDVGSANICIGRSAAPLANTNTTGEINILGARITTPTDAGTGALRWADAPRIHNHILNFNNPHQVTWPQVSPLTTKGDIAVFNTRLPVGANNYVLIADSTQTLGLRWKPIQTGAFFAVAAGANEVYTLSKRIGYFVYHAAQYAILMAPKLTFYLQLLTTASITIGTDTFNYNTSGFKIESLTMPLVDTVLECFISAADQATFTGVYVQFS